MVLLKKKNFKYLYTKYYSYSKILELGSYIYSNFYNNFNNSFVIILQFHV